MPIGKPTTNKQMAKFVNDYIASNSTANAALKVAAGDQTVASSITFTLFRTTVFHTIGSGNKLN